MSSARTLFVLAAVAAFAVVGTLAFAFVSQNRVDVYFDNGLNRTGRGLGRRRKLLLEHLRGNTNISCNRKRCKTIRGVPVLCVPN